MKPKSPSINIFKIIVLVTGMVIQVSAQTEIPKHVISINIMSIFGPSNPNLEITYEHRFNDRFSTEIGINPILSITKENTKTPSKFNQRGLAIKIEPKIAIRNSIKDEYTEQFFLSFKLYKAWNNYTASRLLETNHNILETYKVKTQTLGLIPQIGGRAISENSVIEFSGGYGKRIIKIENNYQDDFQLLSRLYRFTEFIQPEKSGKHNLGAITFNAKLGAIF